MKLNPLSLGCIVAATISACCSTPAAAATTKTIVVTSATGANVPGSLTAAIYQANYQGADINYINFNIPGLTGETEITLSETLFIARPMIINAATQPGYAGQPLIRINCNRLNSGFHVVPAGSGLPGGGGSTIQGLRIVNYSSNAVTLSRGADSNVIADNYIGFAPLPLPGTYFKNTLVAPECRGIGVESSSNVIRGNTISGVHNGITLAGDEHTGAVSRNNRIERNFIGTDPTGTTKIGNDSDGIFLTAGAQDNLIGPGNVLSGMTSAGIELLHFTATGNRIFGNMIGLNAAGTEPIPNGELGVLIAGGASGNWIGGPEGGPHAGNVISACGFGAVAIGTAEFPGPDGSNDNHVEGNLIGTNAAGNQAIGTQITGITVQSNSKRNVIRKNVIVGQLHHGVMLAEASNNAIYGNWIGVTSKGTPIGNGGFGVYLLNASYNVVQPSASTASPGKEQNFFGVNGLGPVGLNGVTIDNVIEFSTPPPPPPPPPPPSSTSSRLLNISTRMRVEKGENALIAGFIITGDSPKKVIVRGMATSLGIDSALADPTLELNTGETSMVNDDWRSNQEGAIIASGVPPTSDLESAIVATLQPGSYTAILRGKDDTVGLGLLELYDLESSAPALLANISTRGIVQSGTNVMIAGFILGGGTTESRIVVRALGHSLRAAGVLTPLEDPTLQLIDSNGTLVRQSDNWQDDAAQAAQLTTIAITPTNALESALVATLPAGAYTAVVADKSGRAGTGLVEVYSVP